jgi:hypothetical protein
MAPWYRSTDELFTAARSLFERLEADGHAEAAAELRGGYSCLNGLTDGWAMFLESIDKVRKTRARSFQADDRRALRKIRWTVWRAVYWPR